MSSRPDLRSFVSKLASLIWLVTLAACATETTGNPALPTLASDEPGTISPWAETVAPDVNGTGNVAPYQIIHVASDVVIKDLMTGKETSLGPNASIEAQSDKYVFWFNYCGPCPADRPVGLYVHVLETGADIFLNWLSHDVKIQGDWAVYTAHPEQADGTWGLRLRHLPTGQDIELTSYLKQYDISQLEVLFDLNEGKVAWVKTDPRTKAQTIDVLDIASKTTKVLNPGIVLEDVRLIAVSSSLVVWVNGHKPPLSLGYDQVKDKLLAFPKDERNYGRYEVEGDLIKGLALRDGYWTVVATAQVTRKR